MSYELTGIIKQIGEVQSFGSNGFSKREFVVTTDEQYPQDVALEFVKEKCGKLDAHRRGESVTVSFNIRGREYNGRHFNNLQAWRIQSNVTAPPASSPETTSPDTKNEDVPF